MIYIFRKFTLHFAELFWFHLQNDVFPSFFRSLPDHDGVRVLEVRQDGRSRRVRSVLPHEPFPGRVHHLCWTGGVPQVHGELSLLGDRYCNLTLNNKLIDTNAIFHSQTLNTWSMPCRRELRRNSSTTLASWRPKTSRCTPSRRVPLRFPGTCQRWLKLNNDG